MLSRKSLSSRSTIFEEKLKETRRLVWWRLSVNFLLPDKVEGREEGRQANNENNNGMRHCTDKPLCVPSLKGSPRARYEHVLRNQCRRETVRSTVGRAPFSRIFDLCDNILFQLFQTSILDIYIYKLFWFRNESLVYLSSIWSDRTIVSTYRRRFEVSWRSKRR